MKILGVTKAALLFIKFPSVSFDQIPNFVWEKVWLLFFILLTVIPLPVKGEEAPSSEKPSTPSAVVQSKTPFPNGSENGVTWLMTIPTADTLRDGQYNLGLIQGGTIPFHADIGGLWDNLEVGIHGVKLRFLKEGSPWASLAVGATFGYYPSGAYIVGSKSLKDFRAHLGARFLTFKFKENQEISSNDNMTSGSSGSGMSNSEEDEGPVIIFGGIGKPIPKLDNALLMLEAGDSINGGVRFFLNSSLQVDVGVRVAWPERIRNKLGKSIAYNIVSRDTTAYLALNYSSEFKFKGGEKDEKGEP